MVVGIIPSTGLSIVGLCLRNMLSLLESQLMLSPFFLLCGGFSCSALIVGLFVYIFIPFAGGVVLLATSVTGVTDAFTPPLR